MTMNITRTWRMSKRFNMNMNMNQRHGHRRGHGFRNGHRYGYDIDSNASMDNFNRAFVIKKRTKNIESVKFLYINISEISVLPLSSLNGN